MNRLTGIFQVGFLRTKEFTVVHLEELSGSLSSSEPNADNAERVEACLQGAAIQGKHLGAGFRLWGDSEKHGR